MEVLQLKSVAAATEDEKLVKGMDTFAISAKNAGSESSTDKELKPSPVALAVEEHASTEAVAATPKPASSGQRCNTCGGSFATPELYRAHFKSKWHTHNLKLKMKGLPPVPSQEEYDRLTPEELRLADTEY